MTTSNKTDRTYLDQTSPQRELVTGLPPLLRAVPDGEPVAIVGEYIPPGDHPVNQGAPDDHGEVPPQDRKTREEPDAEADNQNVAWIYLITSSTPQKDCCRYLREWAKGVALLPELERQAEQGRAAQSLKYAGVHSPAPLLKKALKEAMQKRGSSTEGFKLVDPVPSSKPVIGADLVARLVLTLRRYAILTESAYVAVALWILLTFVFDHFSICPLLVLASPTLRCGKSTVMALLSALTPRAIMTSNLTRAVLFRIADVLRPTLLLEEFETYAFGDEIMRGIINGGHMKAQAFVLRAGPGGSAKAFSSWCPKALALIGRPSATIRDRSILIPIRRKSPKEKVEQLRLDRLSEFQPLVQDAARWAIDNGKQLVTAEPWVPPEIKSDRARDNWRPLLAIADALGGEWPALARQAAIELSTIADNDIGEDLKVLLLEDIRVVFDTLQVDRVATAQLLHDLLDMEQRPWRTCNSGRALSPEKLSAMLRQFDIHSHKWAEPGAVRKFPNGYLRTDFADAFERYLSPHSAHSPQGNQP
jgi:putative DNA primase/helicase